MKPEQLHGYTSAVGDNNVREKISQYLRSKYNCNVQSNLIYMTAGAAASLTISLNAILNEGDEVIVLTPYFPEYKVFIEKAGCKVVEVKTTDLFKPDLNLLDKAINKNTKAIIINYPNNPTGVVLNKKELSLLCDLLNKKQQEFQSNIYLISVLNCWIFSVISACSASSCDC